MGTVGILLLCLTSASVAAMNGERDLEQMQRELQALRDEAAEQQRRIDAAIARIEDAEREMRELRERPAPARPSRDPSGRVIVGGRGALAYFHSGSAGQFPNGEFRPDEARLFVEAHVWRNVFAYAELNLVTREDPDENFELGELYLDFENLSGLWRADGLLSLRLGRFYIPFGEEYLVRGPIDNPLISHSLSDIWGVDEGIMVFGRRGSFQYAIALQNGSHPALRDFHPDKSIAGRIQYAPVPWLSTSFSAMRTGKIDVERDVLTEVWFGNGFIRSLGNPGTTSTFEAELFQADISGSWSRGHLKAAGGIVRYRDNDTAAANERETYYYHVEGKRSLAGSLYAAARFSRIHAPDGFLIVGHGNRRAFFFDPNAPLTHHLWRLSLGLGYPFSPDLILKVEFTREDGRLLDGRRRQHHDFFGSQLTFRF